MGAGESGANCSGPCCNQPGEEPTQKIAEFAPRGVWEVEIETTGGKVLSRSASEGPDKEEVNGGGASGSQSRPADEAAPVITAPGPPRGRLPQGPPATRFDEELRELRALPADGLDGLRPSHRFSFGATYLGQWRGNARHGQGLQTWADGARYAGSWADDCAEGPGELRHPSGDTYVGQWKANKAFGRGVYSDGRGLATYTGDWVEDLQHGYGTERRITEYHYHGRLVLSGASHYQGQFASGKKDGFGVFQWPDKSKYCGQWRGNVMDGIGHYMDPDKRDFRGQWCGTMFHGIGKYTWPNGDTFCGYYKSDLRHGFGIFRSKYGKRTEGWWAEGKRNGGGVYYLSDNTLARQGVWQDGSFVDETTTKP